MEQFMHYEPSDVIGRECKNIAYTTDEEKRNDCVLVKEVIHTKDNRLIPRIKIHENVRRPIYITQEPFRNHKEKKEYEVRSKCQELWTTDVNMSNVIQMGLGARFPDPNKKLRMVCRSPFVYWADLSVGTWIRANYKSRWPDAISNNRLCVYDVETNEMDGTKEPWIMSIVVDDEIHFFGTKKYMSRMKDANTEIATKAKELLSKVPFINKKTKQLEHKNIIDNFQLFIYTCDTVGQCIERMFGVVHEKLPDLFVAWNHEFDLTKIIEALELEGIDPAEVLSHPDVPKKYRRYWFKRDQANRKTESKKLTKSPADQWHVLYCMASFYAIDAMCLFKKIRVAEGNRPNYKLSTTVSTEIGFTKLDIPGLPYEDNLQWHINAQRDFPAEYAVYNIMDNLLILLMDEQNGDLASAVSVLIGVSTYDIFPSLPKRLCDAFTFKLKEEDLVIGSVGSAMRNEFDEEVIGTDGWIVTLPAHMNAENGIPVIAEVDQFYSAFRVGVADADLTQAYPSATNMTNQSRETTIIELIDIDGVPESVRRFCGINHTAGKVNAMSIANEMFGLPEKDTMMNAFLNRMQDNTNYYTYQ